MKKTRSALLVALVTAGLLATGGAAAQATTEYPAGGTWIYGVYSGGEFGSGETVRSDYFHASRVHKSTACNGLNECDYQSWHSPGWWSKARYAGATLWGNTSYWDVQ